MVSVTEAETLALVHWMYETLILCGVQKQQNIENIPPRAAALLRNIQRFYHFFFIRLLSEDCQKFGGAP